MLFRHRHLWPAHRSSRPVVSTIVVERNGWIWDLSISVTTSQKSWTVPRRSTCQSLTDPSCSIGAVLVPYKGVQAGCFEKRQYEAMTYHAISTEADLLEHRHFEGFRGTSLCTRMSDACGD
jgi:hypothetical protein